MLCPGGGGIGGRRLSVLLWSRALAFVDWWRAPGEQLRHLALRVGW
jgi:hypothetical protein